MAEMVWPALLARHELTALNMVCADMGPLAIQ